MSMEKPQANSTFLFPPGVRFHPSDEELIVYYLLNKLNSRPLPAAVVGEIELYNHNPWELPKKALFGEDEWYFFSPRERKYPNGARPNRSAASGYWKATGTDKVITSCSSGSRIGVKKALVFYVGKPPNGIKTDWIMIEYRIPDTLIRPQKSKGSMRLDHWVLCRIRQKGNMSKNIWDSPENQNKAASGDDIPNMNDMPPVTANKTLLSDVYLQSKDCQLLAKLAVSNQDSPPLASASRENSNSHSGGNIGKLYTAAYEQDSNVDNHRSTDYFEGYYLNQQAQENGNGNGNFSQYTRGMPNLNNNNENNDAGYSMPPPSNTNFYNPHESRDMFTLNLSGAMTNLQGLDNVSPFGGRFQQ